MVIPFASIPTACFTTLNNQNMHNTKCTKPHSAVRIYGQEKLNGRSGKMMVNNMQNAVLGSARFVCVCGGEAK